MFGFLKKSGADPKERLQALMGDFTLPSFSGLVSEVLAALRDPDISGNDVAEKISLDPALAVEVLRISNSAAFATRQEIEDLSQAVMMLGLSKLETVVLPFAMRDVAPSESSSVLDIAHFWQTAAVRAATARHLATQWHPGHEGECFLAGYLQDIAIPFLLHARPDDYAPLLTAAASESPDWLAAQERERFEWDHAEVATWMLNEWGLSEGLAVAIGGHHGADVGEHPGLESVRVTASIAGFPDTDATALSAALVKASGNVENPDATAAECLELGADLAGAIG